MTYRYAHFSPRVVVEELRAMGAGPRAGDRLPDFDLPRADGGRLRLRDLRGRPVLLYTAAYT